MEIVRNTLLHWGLQPKIPPIHFSYQDLVPCLPTLGTCEADHRPLCIRELIICLFVCLSLHCLHPQKECWVSQGTFGNASICVVSWFPESISLSPQNDTNRERAQKDRKHRRSALKARLDLDFQVSFNLLCIPPAHHLSLPTNWGKFVSLIYCHIDFHLCWKLHPQIKECVN